MMVGPGMGTQVGEGGLARSEGEEGAEMSGQSVGLGGRGTGMPPKVGEGGGEGEGEREGGNIIIGVGKGGKLGKGENAPVLGRKVRAKRLESLLHACSFPGAICTV